MKYRLLATLALILCISFSTTPAKESSSKQLARFPQLPHLDPKKQPCPPHDEKCIIKRMKEQLKKEQK